MKKTKILSFFLAVLMMIGTLTMGMTANAAGVSYSDVTEDMWSYKDIVYVTENGLMNGTGGSTFSPTVSLTRAMVVTVLWRMEGSPRADFRPLFIDVEPRLFYSEAVIWAKEKGIVTATSVTKWGEEYFSPDREITRQELATMFVRYAEYKHIITDNDTTLDRFTDKSSVADWANAAMKWATDTGLINGTGSGSTLSPTGKATREQFAAIIHRFDTIKFDYKLVYSEPKPTSKYTELPYHIVKDADVYVAVDGSDTNPGTIDLPLATLDAARLKVRELKKTAKDEIKVAFKAGNYGILDNVTFTNEDSGSEAVPVKYCKYGDGDVIFQNGIVIKDEEFTKLDDAEAKLFPERSRDFIFKADLSGRVDKFEFNTRLFSETGLAIEAREPNNRYYTNMTTTEDPMWSIKLQVALPGVVEKFRSVDGMKVNGYLRTGYTFDCFPVKSYDKETKVLTFDFDNYEFNSFSGYPLDELPLMEEGRTDDLIYFSNLPEFIDQAGEYWFDNSTDTLYIYGATGDYALSQGGTYITVNEGAEYLSFVGFEFNGSASDAVVVSADHFTLDLCRFCNIGGFSAVYMPTYVTSLTVSNSEFFNCVDSCIYMRPEENYDVYDATDVRRYLVPGNNVITNNYFHDFTLPEYFSAAVTITEDVGTEISHNYFYNGAHGAIVFGTCIDAKIEYNVFDNIVNKTQDYGAVYTWNSITCRDNHIRYNIFKNIPIYAIYLDDNTAGQQVYGNVFYNNGAGIVQNGGRENHIFDNVFIKCEISITYPQSYYGYILNDNIEDIYSTGFYKRFANAKPLQGEDGYDEWFKRWPELYLTSFDPKKVGDLDCVFTPITYASGNAGFGVTVDDCGEIHKGVDETNLNYTLDENPYFVNPAVGDYRVLDGADFFKIPYEKIGRY